MIPVKVAALMALFNLTLTSVGGGLCGVVASFVLRLRWRGRIFLQDMGIAAAGMASSVLIVVGYDSLSGSLHDHLITFVCAGLATPVARHLVRFVLARPHTKRSHIA